MMRVLAAFVLFGVVAVANAVAGQIHVQTYGLDEVRGSVSYIHAGTVISADPQKGVITVQQTRTWKAPEMNTEPPPPPPVVKIYAGVEWTDPNESPIEQRLHGGVSIDAIAEGEEVILVPLGTPEGPHELLRADASTTRKLDIFYGPGGLDGWAREASVAELDDALGDFDLAQAAYRRLAAEGMLSAETLVKVAAGNDPRRILWTFFGEADAATRARILADAESLLRETPAALAPFVRAAAPKFDTTDAGALATLASMLDPRERDQQGAVFDVRHRLIEHAEGKRSAAIDPFVGFLVRFERYRPDDMSTDDDFETLLAGLSARSRLRFIPAMITNVYKTSHAREGIDAFVFFRVVQSMKQYPEREYLTALQVIDPALEPIRGTRERIMNALLEVAIATAKKNHGSSRAAFELIEPWLLHGVEAESGLRGTYEKLTRSHRKQHRKATTEIAELRAGESRVLPSGYRVLVAGTGGSPEKAGVFSSLTNGQTRVLDAAWDGYSEGLEGERIFTVERGGGAVIKIALLSATSGAVPKSEANLSKLAERAAAAKGCTRGSGRLIAAHGVYRWEGTGSRYRCVALVGAFTGWLGRVDREAK